MPTLRELKKRLQGVKTTGKLAGAMRTVSTAKYSRVGLLKKQSAAYCEAESLILSALDLPAWKMADEPAKKRRLWAARANDEGFDEEAPLPRPLAVLVSGNKGLSGGCDHELNASFLKAIAKYEREPVVIACGKKAAEFCREKGFETAEEITIPDVPGFETGAMIAEKLEALYSGGGFSCVDIYYQHAHNMLKREPVMHRFLPREDAPAGEKKRAEVTPIFVPDAETVRHKLLPCCRAAEIYALLLDSASAVQSATLVAMRSAYDNASAQAELLETAINRRRQQEVTSSVLETSSGIGVD